MKKAILSIFIISLFLSLGFSQNNLYSLKINIIGLKNDKGNIFLQLFNEKNEIVIKKQAKIENKKCTFFINNLAKGKYSIRYFHDENNNNSLDNNWLGLPNEGYGFSNNAKSNFGPPPIEKRLFLISKNSEITLTINC